MQGVFRPQVISLDEARMLEVDDEVAVVVSDHEAEDQGNVALQFGLPTLVLGPDDPASMVRAIEAGAIGYEERNKSLDHIVEAALRVSKGEAVIPPFMLGSLLRHVVDRARNERESLTQLDVLTSREREVFELAAFGMGHDEIAERLYISPATSRTHLHRIFKKLDIHSKAELVALAAACGLATSEEP